MATRVPPRWHGWRLNEESHHDFVFQSADEEHRVRVAFRDDGLRLEVDGRPVAGGANAVTVRDGRNWHVFHDGTRWTLALKDDLPDVEVEASGTLAAPMPGRVIKLLTKSGTRVAKGQPLLILEAMKMEHTIAAPADGTVKEILYGEGDQVLEGAELLRLE
jgi:3-methylcrotonyl-CoA carboxylase alpha subunit